jgi:hypothetical protein
VGIVFEVMMRKVTNDVARCQSGRLEVQDICTGLRECQIFGTHLSLAPDDNTVDRAIVLFRPIK